MIKAIPTEYKGYPFRSRLEARWAVFFDLIGVSYQYELEPYVDTNTGVCYLPDFYLPKNYVHLEVKPFIPSKEEIEKSSMAAKSSQKRLGWGQAIIVEGDPFYPKLTTIYYRDWGKEEACGGFALACEAETLYDANEDGYFIISSGVLSWKRIGKNEDAVFPDGSPFIWHENYRSVPEAQQNTNQIYHQAMIKARQWRFY